MFGICRTASGVSEQVSSRSEMVSGKEKWFKSEDLRLCETSATNNCFTYVAGMRMCGQWNVWG